MIRKSNFMCRTIGNFSKYSVIYKKQSQTPQVCSQLVILGFYFCLMRSLFLELTRFIIGQKNSAKCNVTAQQFFSERKICTLKPCARCQRTRCERVYSTSSGSTDICTSQSINNTQHGNKPVSSPWQPSVSPLRMHCKGPSFNSTQNTLYLKWVFPPPKKGERNHNRLLSSIHIT